MTDRAVIYARFSSTLQKESSLEDQVALCRTLAEREGLQVINIYSDAAQSGTGMQDRPGLRQMLTDGAAGQFDVLISEGLDRLSRNQRDIAEIHQNLTFDGVRIVTQSEGAVDMLHIGLKGTMNALFVKDLKIKVKRGQVGAVRAGRVPGGILYGYRKIFAEQRGLREPHPEQAEIVRRIYDEYGAGRPLLAIMRGLNDDGVPAARGGVWTRGSVSGSASRASGILHNPVYRGLQCYNRQSELRDPRSGRKITRLNPREAWVWQDAPHLRIVSDAQWNRVQSRLSGPQSRAIKPVRESHSIISGLVRCGQCGETYTSRGAGRLVCRAHRYTKSCDNGRSAMTREIEQRSISALARLAQTPNVFDIYADEYLRVWQREAGDRTTETQAAEDRKRDHQTKIDNLVKSVESGLVSPAITKAIHHHQTELERLKFTLRRLRNDVRAPDIPGLKQIWLNSISRFDNMFDGQLGADARDTFRHIVKKLTIHPIGNSFDIAVGVGVVGGEGLEPPTNPL